MKNERKSIIDKILDKALTRLLDVLVNALEKWLNIDIDGDGDIGKKDE